MLGSPLTEADLTSLWRSSCLTKELVVGRIGRPTPILQAALNCAQLGVPVIPLQPGSKTPLSKHGLKDATTDPKIIRRWWQRSPNANLGVRTGEKAGIFVLDIDGKVGEASIVALEGTYGKLPSTREALTGGGGRHLFFKHPGYQIANVQNGKFGAGLDIRGDGGYVVVPPSIHSNGNRYRFRNNPHQEIADAPEWFLDLLHDPIPDARNGASPGIFIDGKIPQGKRHRALVSFAGKLRHVGATAQEILAALVAYNDEHCDPPKSHESFKKLARDMAKRYRKGAAVEIEWLGLQPLPKREPVVPCDPDTLPPVIAEWATDLAERASVPIDLPLAAAIVCLAAAIGRRAVIQPKQFDVGFVVVPNLWGVIVAEPGSKKTYVINEAKRALQEIDRRWRREFGEARRSFEQEMRAFNRSGAAANEDREPPTAPVRHRLLVNDVTAEALHELLAENPGGVLVLRDELTGWLATLDKRGREGERGFFLEAWSGDGAYQSIRISRGATKADPLCVSLLGGVQPGPWTKHVEQAPEDGLLQRFQLLVWPDPLPQVRPVDRAPNHVAARRLADVFERLVGMPVNEPLYLRFSPQAQQLHDEWLLQLEETIAEGGDRPALTNHRAKYGSLMPSLACIFELVESESPQSIGLEATRRAAAFCDYLDSHAVRSYGARSESSLQAARSLADKLKAGAIGAGGQFSLREVYRPGWGGLASKEEAKAACEILMDYDWIRPLGASHTPGRPSTGFEVNPEVRP